MFIPLNSSQLKGYIYLPSSETLYIEFHGGNVYEYKPVSQELCDRLVNSPSIGSTFHSLIKRNPNIEWAQLDPSKVAELSEVV